MPNLTLSQLTKSFGATRALREVSFDVAPGERIALLGHNGAGKSTLMKIVLGLIPYDSGRVEVLGASPGDRAARRQVAYLPENVAFHPALTGLEQIRTYLRLRGAPVREAMGLLERVGLAEAAKRRIGTYSKGMRQRVGLAQALIGRPRLLVLDEPTSGLDPVSRREFYATLDGLAAEGASILLSSHALTEVEARTDRIVILSKGVMVANAALAELRRKAALPIQMQVRASAAAADQVAARLGGARFNGATVTLSCAPDQKLARLGQVTALGDMIEDVEVIPPSLEDLYTHFSKQVQP
ncbi:ABC transporter ATP-binding protein [Roseinatronobacter bogoriensis]|uniref:ABC transporter ATP-binding protein n=1 Tax=Roseinatronobacter bogoriensis subsp. barguzinensis TaxID=441209 RepID=A0A2K8KDG2_9RHOB|nr:MULTISPECIES: ABC transporter ATP-binding protein [Rhodobaca]ATX67474.1 ABC transporter ATP-binding protein [Rhodobaca barguzinensis]MBB4207063.1 Cu-processing system ATP-binding protein [Rhodobaca bogoriensis DSM 18756]TDW36006.1 Cu-processing system ATP-binding protein [Rhodobaca barguzinensis]TDY74019.1 Cu-processing system ATP-binding protein [Rhodobaca bogoriensis DSM 18756]